MSEEVEAVLKEVIESKASDLNEEQKKKLLEVGTKLFEEGVMPKEAMGLSDQTVEAMYAHGYRLYQAAKYGAAGHIFRMLTTLDPTEPKYYLGMGACLHRMKEYEPAVFMYELCGEMNKQDPMPLYYASDCRFNLGHDEIAIDELEQVIKRSEGKPEFARVADRAKMTLKSKKENKPKEAKPKEEK